MIFTYAQLEKIFRVRRLSLSSTDLDARAGWLCGMIQGSGMEIKEWMDFAVFNKANPDLEYELEFQRYSRTGQWLVCEPSYPRAYCQRQTSDGASNGENNDDEAGDGAS